MTAAKKILPVAATSCDNVSKSDILKMAITGGMTNICQTSNTFYASDFESAKLISAHPRIFFKHPVASIFNPENANAKSDEKHIFYKHTFSAARQKAGVLDEIDAALDSRDVSPSIKADILIVADELFTNAVFNAPFVDLENSASGASREDQSVKMHDGKFAEIFLATDNTRIVVGCRDPYGSLNLMKLLQRIKKCYDTSVAENMNMSQRGGAGIGAFMVFDASTSFFGAVDVGVETLICSVFPTKMSSRTRLSMPKNLHLVFKK
jgi:hypothetical protein